MRKKFNLESVASAQLLKLAILVVALVLPSCRQSAVEAPLQKSDAIVLMAGNHSERAPAAALLFRDGYADLIILTNDGVGGRWSNKYNRSLKVIEWAEEDLITLGVPRSRIVKLPFYSSGTIYDALSVLRYARNNGLNKLIIVTSDYHMRRSLWCFLRFRGDSLIKFFIFPVKSLDNKPIVWGVEKCKYLYYWLKVDLLHIMPDLTIAD